MMESLLNGQIPWIVSLQHMGTWLKLPMQVFSALGNEYFFLLLLPTLYWCVEARTGLMVGFIMLLNNSVNLFFKLAFASPRPYWFSSQVMQYAQEVSFGMPSNHAQTAMVIWGSLASRLRKWWGWLAAGILILLIGLSRIYLGVHFPIDFVLGLALGAVELCLLLRFWRPISTRVGRLSLVWQVLAALFISAGMILLPAIPYACLKLTNWQPLVTWSAFAGEAVGMTAAFTVAGTMFGFLAGFAWLKHRGGFSTHGPVWKRLLRFLVGIAGVLLFYILLDWLFGIDIFNTIPFIPELLRFIRYAVVGAWVAAGAPMLFFKLNLAESESK
jgi:membrane-associated phospholipid phosphatase